MKSKIEELGQQSKSILSKIGEQTEQVGIRSLLYQGNPIYLLEYKQISSTMVLSENWPCHSVQQYNAQKQTAIEDLKLEQKQQIFVFYAKKQKSGRGQKNNKWCSPEGNIYMTILLRIGLNLIGHLYMLIGAAIIQTIEKHFGIPESIKIKWVNDIFIAGSKVGGILIKCDIEGEYARVQIGIGINVNQKIADIQSTCLTDHLFHSASSLMKETAQQKNSKSMGAGQIKLSWQQLSEIVEKITINVVQNLRPSDSNSCLQRCFNLYASRLLYKGQEVQIYNSDLTHVINTGIFVGITKEGFLILENSGNKIIIPDGRMRKL